MLWLLKIWGGQGEEGDGSVDLSFEYLETEKSSL